MADRSRIPAPAPQPAEAPTDPLPFLPFSRPSIGAREQAAVAEVLASGWLTTGAQAAAFEREFGAFVGATHAVALNSATAALHLALEALGVGPGDEVIVPTWTFAASAEVVVWLGARPVLVDVDRETLNLSVDGVLAAVTERTKAVVPVHIAGRPLPIVELVERLAGRGIAVVEDAAHAFPSRLAATGRLAGTIGTVGCFSFYATKTITTGEGGMLVTDDEAVADRARLMSLHGISRTAWNRYTAAGSWFYAIEDAGYKYNMTDLAAALGRVQLSRADELLTARRALAGEYTARLAASRIADRVELPTEPPDGSHAWHLYILRLHLDRLRIDRAEVIARLKVLGIGTSVHFIPLHLHPYYQERWGYTSEAFPVATAEFDRVISLPLWPGMTRLDVERVVVGLEQVLDEPTG